ncbi:MAG: arginase family protein [Actinomycetota bacterium]
MEVAFAMGMVDVSWSPDLAGILPLVAAPDVSVLGARDAAELEAEGVPSIAGRVHVVDGLRLAADPAGETVAATASFAEPWWFHLDLDVLSTAALPAVDYRQDGGLGWDQLDQVGETALRARPVGCDVTIYNPDLDPDRTHARRIVRFLGSAVRALPPDRS